MANPPTTYSAQGRNQGIREIFLGLREPLINRPIAGFLAAVIANYWAAKQTRESNEPV